ncbi:MULTISPECIES: hypothetical protein [unclassified Rathayibacter]|uniref:hypothetical protein n=1 Tax=unclassified Rathayibacter TaxID=2609250 RepID=UPI00188D2E0D|nr:MULTISPECIES: hypothetical protein [unclassified Rathayibacter]MBF4462456.1 hypothetical protein [Rathayibacter sp. VKM Ac-2879]MBF4503501.1 hypothetical protein [Rathayibacter sp. VKM Ac-2878]
MSIARASGLTAFLIGAVLSVMTLVIGQPAFSGVFAVIARLASMAVVGPKRTPSRTKQTAGTDGVWT